MRQLGSEAGVHFVLMGSVTSSGDKLRISAQLSDTHTGCSQLWSTHFDGDQGDLFSLQDQVTTRNCRQPGRRDGDRCGAAKARSARARRRWPTC